MPQKEIIRVLFFHDANFIDRDLLLDFHLGMRLGSEDAITMTIRARMF